MFKRLTDEEISKSFVSDYVYQKESLKDFQKVAQAQLRADLKAMIEWGENVCWKHYKLSRRKRGCPMCWQELKSELVKLEE
jgi:hypothetical protein